MSSSFSGIRDQATFTASSLTFGSDEGKVCKVTANQTAGLCSDGDRFHGIIETIERDEAVCVVRKTGYVTLSYTGSDPTAGIVKLSADASGGVKVDNTTGIEYLVVDVDTSGKTATIFLG